MAAPRRSGRVAKSAQHLQECCPPPQALRSATHPESRATLFLVVPGIVLSLSWTLSFYFLLDKGKNPIEAIKASNDATYGSKWTMFFVILVFSIIMGIVYGIFLFVCEAIDVAFITFVVMFILLVLAASIAMAIDASFWKQLKDNVE